MSQAVYDPSTDPRSQPLRIPGNPDVWVLIVAEVATFGVFFITYMIYRAQDVLLFNTSQLMLRPELGLLSTIFLVTSSWVVVQAVEAARRNNSLAVQHYLLAGILFAVLFGVVKYVDYSDKFIHGITLTTNMFFIFYFSLTMIHMLHVIAGTIILCVVYRNARKGLYRPGFTQGIETAASYWHMVDLLWIFLFALLYLLR